MTNRGFTLIEMVVVLALIAVATALSLPSIGRGVETLRIRSEAGGVVAFLRYSRQQAITKARAQTVKIDPASRTLLLLEEGGEDAYRTRQIANEIRLLVDPPEQTAITFAPQGFSSGGSVLLEGRGGRAYRITVNPMTGRVTNTRAG